MSGVRQIALQTGSLLTLLFAGLADAGSGPRDPTVRFWGVRSMMSVPGSETSRYGGNTLCVEVQVAPDQFLILDGGTGLAALGRSIPRERPPKKMCLLLSNTHLDHLSGMLGFEPWTWHDSSPLQVEIFGPRMGENGSSIEQTVQRLFSYELHPVRFGELSPNFIFRELDAEAAPLSLEGVRVTAVRSNTPILSFAYRIEVGRKVIVYQADHEPYHSLFGNDASNPMVDELNKSVADFARKADIYITSAAFGPGTWDRHKGSGHSTVDQAVDRALSAGARHLVLIGYAPDVTDNEIDQWLVWARGEITRRGSSLIVTAAREGEVLTP